MTALESCCLLKMLDQYSHVPSSYDRQGSNGVEIHSQVPNVHILENDKDEVSHHAHACRGLLSHDVTSTQWTRKVPQHKTEPCNGMASGGSPGAYYVDGLVTLGVITFFWEFSLVVALQFLGFMGAIFISRKWAVVKTIVPGANMV